MFLLCRQRSGGCWTSIDEEIESNLLVNYKIHNDNTRSNNQMSILLVNRSQTKYCVRHNGMLYRGRTYVQNYPHIISLFLN